DLHERLARARLRPVDVDVLEDLGATRRADLDYLHDSVPVELAMTFAGSAPAVAPSSTIWIVGRQRTGKFTELATKHFSCARRWSSSTSSRSAPGRTSTRGARTTSTNRPPPPAL